MKKIIPFVLLASIVIFSHGCKKITKSEKVAEQFYSALISNNYEEVIALMSEEFRAMKPDEEWINIFKKRNKNCGIVKSYNKVLSETKQSSKGGQIVELRYKVENTDGTTYELLRFLEENGEMKIAFYSYTDKPEFKTTVSEQEAITNRSFPKQEKTIERFYELEKSRDFYEMRNLFSDLALSDLSLDDLEEYMVEKSNYYGEIIDIEKYYADTKKHESILYYIIIYKITYGSGKVCFDKFEFTKNTQADKIDYYQIDEDYYELLK